jgi:hypothetical protein
MHFNGTVLNKHRDNFILNYLLPYSGPFKIGCSKGIGANNVLGRWKHLLQYIQYRLMVIGELAL